MYKQRRGIGYIIARIFASLLLFILLQIIAGILSAILPATINPLLATCLVSLLQMLLFTLLLGIYMHMVEHRSLKDIGLLVTSKTILHLIGGLLLGVIAILLVTLPLYITGKYQISLPKPNMTTIPVALMGLISFISIGYTEELLFRGAHQDALLRLGPMAALILSSVVFSSLHLLNPNFSWLPYINIILAGLFMGSVMYLTGDLWASIGFHITWNWIQGSVLGIPVSGLQVRGVFSTDILGNNPLWTGGNFGVEGSLLTTMVLTISTILFLILSRQRGKYHFYLNKPNV